MMYVGVRHKPEQDRLYWFTVPDELSSHIQLGSEVLCDTRRGHNKGTVIAILNGVSEDDMFAVAKCRRTPVKSILAVYMEPEIKDIHIPYNMAGSNPPAEKIAKRCSELYNTGSFATPVIFSQDMNLVDGYTAYLVSVMFGRDTIHGYCTVI